MEKKIVVSKRFRKNTLKVYEYLMREYLMGTMLNEEQDVQVSDTTKASLLIKSKDKNILRDKNCFYIKRKRLF